MATKITCKVDNSDCGIYLRWINRHGMWCYWLFMQGDETSQVSNDGEFIRNNMQDYSYKNGYHGGSGRKQRKMEETTLPVIVMMYAYYSIRNHNIIVMSFTW